MPSNHQHNQSPGSPTVLLRRVRPEDLTTLFELQADPVSNAMAGTKPRSREVFFAAWERNFVDPGITAWMIEIVDAAGSTSNNADQVRTIVGTIARHQADGRDAVGYWIDQAHWGKGIASRALELFLKEEHRRPLRATAASTNAASRRILEKCGFRCVGLRMGEETDRYVAREIADYVLE